MNDPNPRRVLAGVLFLAALGIVSALLLRSLATGPTPAGLAGLPGGADIAPQGATGPAQLAAAGAEGAGSKPLARPASAADADQRHALDGMRAVDAAGGWIEGRVVLPAGTPADEDARVRAFRAPATPAARARAQRPLIGGDGWEPDAAPSPAPAVEEPLARAALAPDGAFRLPLPADVDLVHLDVDGRYLFLGERVRARAGARGVALEPRLGAWVRGRLVPPEGLVLGAEARAQLAGTEVSLRSASDDFDPIARERRETKTGAELDFEFRAVAGGRTYVIDAEPSHLAALRIDGVATTPGARRDVELALVRGALIAGVVLDGEREPLAGAKVSAIAIDSTHLFGGSAARETESDADGRFALDGLPPGRARVSAVLDGFLPGSAGAIELVEGGERGVEIVLLRGNRIAGHVTWPDGSPAAGARVKAQPEVAGMTGTEAFNGFAGLVSWATADDDGAFALEGLGKGPFRLTARAHRDGAQGEESGEAHARDVPAWRTSPTLVLATPLAVRGRVSDADGAPVRAFRVEASIEVDDTPFGALFEEQHAGDFADDEGAFELAGLSPGKWSLWIEASGFAPAGPLAVELPAPDTEPLAIGLARESAVLGVVRTPTGEPIAGAEVRVHVGGIAMPGLPRPGPEPPSARSDADGRFELRGLAAGSIGLFARAQGWARSEVVSVASAADERVEGVALVVRTGTLLTGEVYDAEGRAAAGVKVIVQIQTAGIGREGNADGGGRFAFEHLEPGTWQVLAFLSLDAMVGASEGEGIDVAAMMSSMKMAMVEAKDGEPAHVVLGAPPEDPVSVRGTVSAAGAPLDCYVSFMPEGANGLSALKMLQTGKDGAFETRLDKRGRYVVSVQVHEGMSGRSNSVEFVETIPNDVEQHELRLVMPGGRIRGAVFGPDGQPVSGARITLGVDGALSTGSFTGGQYVEAASDADGRYAIEYLRAGAYNVGAGGVVLGGAFGGSSPYGRQVKSNVTLREGQALENQDFHLGAAGAIGGRVRDAAGRPVPSAAVFVRDASGRVLERISFNATDAAGSFLYRGVSAGEYTVSARASGAATQESARVRVRAGETSELELVLEAGTLLLVRTVDADGDDVSATVIVTDELGQQVNGMIGYDDIMTGLQQGMDLNEERVGPLAPGRYFVEAFAGLERSGKKPVQLNGQPQRKMKVRVR